MTFPAGLVSIRNKGLIRNPEWQKSIFCKGKVKLEMFFLPNKTYNHRNKHYTLTIDNRFTPMEWTQLVKD